MSSALRSWSLDSDTASLRSVTTLPAYSAHAPVPTRQTIRPTSARRREPLTEHVFDLSHKKSTKPWASLKLQSFATSSKSLPMFVEGDKLKGSVVLDLEQPEHISLVIVKVQGRLLVGNSDDQKIVFLDFSSVLWGKQHRRTSSISRPSSSSADGLASGKHEWAFALEMPKHAVIQGTPDSHETCPLPESFLERHTRVSINYAITVCIDRGRFRNRSEIETTFFFIQASRPGLPSPARQLAQRDNLLAPGVTTDPEGWKTLPSVDIVGTLFNARKVKVQCELSLARPLTYARGSSIPLALLLSSQDTQALDLLASSSAIHVRLCRRIKYVHIPVANYFHGLVVYNRDEAKKDKVIGVATWFKEEGDEEPFCRRLRGEISLPKNLKPTVMLPCFNMDYYVTFLPFVAAGFTPNSPTESISATEERVEIATMFAKTSGGSRLPLYRSEESSRSR